jgi:two-component system sensor histidine kinase KdpD
MAFLLNDNFGKKKQYLLGILIVCLVSAICFLFSAYIGFEVVAFILLLTLSFIAMFFDIFPVLLAAVLSAFIWDYFFILPRFNFRVGNTEDKIMLSMYFIIALVSGTLTYKIRRIEKDARRKEEKAKTLKLYNTLLNSLSHELRTPVATIIGATDNLLSDAPDLSESDKKKLLTEISTASLRLNQQVENLLNMSRLESGFIRPRLDWCDINELVYHVVQRLDEPLGNYRIQIDIDESLPLVKLDYGLMEQVLYNLIYNATQYTPGQSLIKVKADWTEGQLVIIVEDDGNGFPEEEIDKVFDKFYRLNNMKVGGTGLGLSIVKGFTEAHNGIVKLKNIPTGGARFEIYLPAEEIVSKHIEK